MRSHASQAAAGLPDIDDRLVASETRYEVLDGELVYVPPADAPHGAQHSKISALVEIHVGPAFDVATDMLTRTSLINDVAPDVSVFPSARDPRTGRRQLPELAFELVATQTLGNAAVKAETLVTRGVRRVFAIDIERARAFEWNPALGDWSLLDPDAELTDPVFQVALPIRSLIAAAKTDDAVARALLAKANPVIEAVRHQDRTSARIEGRIEGRIEALLGVLAVRGVVVDDASRARILAEQDPRQLERWTARSVTCTAVAELFGDD